MAKKKTATTQQASADAAANLPDPKQLIAENTSIELTLEWDEVAESYQAQLKEAAKQVEKKGFRKGKVPLEQAREDIDTEQVAHRTLETVTPPRFAALMEEEDYQPLLQPEIEPIEIEEGETWKVKINFAEKPEVDIDGYEALVKQGLEAAEEQLNKLQAANDDDADDDSEEDDKELDDEQKRDIKLRNVFRTLAEEIKPGIPEQLVRHETQHQLRDIMKSLKQMDMDLNDYIQHRGISQQELITDLQAESIARMQIEFILQAITEDLGIEVEESDIEARIEDIDDENLRERARENEQYQQRLKTTLRREKTIEALLEV